MTRQTTAIQIVTMVSAELVNRKEVPDKAEDYFKILKSRCAAIMTVPPSDDEIDAALVTGSAIEFSKLIAGLIGK